MSIVVDLDERRVLSVADDRRADSLVLYLHGLTEAERTEIEAIAMDMWEPYPTTVREQVGRGAESRLERGTALVDDLSALAVQEEGR